MIFSESCMANKIIYQSEVNVNEADSDKFVVSINPYSKDDKHIYFMTPSGHVLPNGLSSHQASDSLYLSPSFIEAKSHIACLFHHYSESVGGIIYLTKHIEGVGLELIEYAKCEPRRCKQEHLTLQCTKIQKILH